MSSGEGDRLEFAVMSWFRRSEEMRVVCNVEVRGDLEFEILEVAILSGHLEPNLHHGNG